MIRKHGKVPIGWQDLVDSDVFPEDKHYEATVEIDMNGESYTHDIASAQVPNRVDNLSLLRRPAIVQSWKCWAGLAAKATYVATSSGHDAITSACWYLDFDSDFEAFMEARPIQTAKKAVDNANKVAATSGIMYDSVVDSFSPVQVPPLGGKKGRRHMAPRGRVLGGEVAVWTEGIDFTNFECRVWPRAAAVAMSMWGMKNLTIDPPGHLDNTTERDWGIAMLSSYLIFSQYLARFGIHPADITFHTKSLSSLGYTPSLVNGSLYEQLEMLRQNDVYLTALGVFSSSELKINSQCPAISEDIIRPLNLVKSEKDTVFGDDNEDSAGEDSESEKRSCCAEVTAVQVNIAEGAGGHRQVIFNRWLKAQARKGVVFIGLCELNMWHELSSTTEAHSNFPVMRRRAAQAGFAFSHILHSDKHPYSVGIMAAVPFKIVGEYGPPLFQRGVLHVYFASLDLHVLVAHLHAHDSSLREAETTVIANIVESYLKKGCNVIVMGDLNSLHLKDKPFHEEAKLLPLFQLTNSSVYKRLKRKFLDTSATAINYKPLQILEKAGLKDVCFEYCNRNAKLLDHGTDRFIEGLKNCLLAKCSFTQPTAYNPEVRVSSSYLRQPSVVLILKCCV